MPSFAGVTPYDDPSSANRRSQAAASWLPPPTQNPRIAASVGFGKAASASSAATASACGSSFPVSEEMSAPAQKVGPAPVRTRTRTAGSAARSASSSGRARHIAAVMAFRLAGWEMTTVATPSATVCRRAASRAASMRRMLSRAVDRAADRVATGTGPGASWGWSGKTGRRAEADTAEMAREAAGKHPVENQERSNN